MITKKGLRTMLHIMYDPKDVGKEVINSRGKKSTIRKYHMTEKEQDLARNKWKKETKEVSYYTRQKAGKLFYNPYRKGVYYYQIYAMFLLGANKWNSLGDIISKMEEIMSQRVISRDGVKMTAWDKFRGKASRVGALRNKDYIGRVQENMVFFQRLNKLHPTGYKLRQVCAAVDMKRIDKAGFPNGCYYYRLSTYDSMDQALPIRDYSDFTFPKKEGKYVSYKFVGTIVTHDKVITEGILNEMSQV
jgi:hypothetical protein